MEAVTTLDYTISIGVFSILFMCQLWVMSGIKDSPGISIPLLTSFFIIVIVLLSIIYNLVMGVT